MLLGRKRCCCGPGCTYFHAVPSAGAEGQVSFADALDDELLLPLTGTWSVGTGGRLRVTGPGKIKINVPQPDGVPRMRLQAGTAITFGPAVNGDAILRYSVDYTDDSNRHYTEGHIRTGLFATPETQGKIARVSGGSETVLWEKPINFADGGANVVGAFCVHDYGVRFATRGADYSYNDPIALPTTAVGGLYAAIEVDQGGSAVHEFDYVLMRKVSVPQCPVHDCDDCFAVGGCSRNPAGFVVGITGVADVSGHLTGVAANFNSSFVVDDIDKYFYGTFLYETSPCYNPIAEMSMSELWGPPYAYKSAVFELDPVIVYTEGFYSTNYTHGRVILIPIATGYDWCDGPRFRLILQIAESDAFNNTCLKWLWVADMQPSTFSGNDVAGDCTALDGATYSDNTATFPREDVQENIAFTVTAL